MPTYGEKTVGLSFNPAQDDNVTDVKQAFADLIDFYVKARAEALESEGVSSERIRLFSIAITEAQTAQMWGVKAITWKD